MATGYVRVLHSKKMNRNSCFCYKRLTFKGCAILLQASTRTFNHILSDFYFILFFLRYQKISKKKYTGMYEHLNILSLTTQNIKWWFRLPRSRQIFNTLYCIWYRCQPSWKPEESLLFELNLSYYVKYHHGRVNKRSLNLRKRSKPQTVVDNIQPDALRAGRKKLYRSYRY